MAQSPEDHAANSEIIRYDLGWNAINSMLRAGRSLSGHERNCCFLNSGGQRFADISSAAGLDFEDDGRVLALADWDYDGDVDFWIANRSGPQLRYLENRLGRDHQFLSVRLQGVHCNRDAIGAKVRLVCESKGRRLVQVQTLRAGEGYLAQNSKWLHFGLGDAAEIRRLDVFWPNGNHQSFDRLLANQWLKLREGDEECTAWIPPDSHSLAEADFTAPSVSDRSRIVLLQPIPLPPIYYRDGSDRQRSLASATGRPRLVNLWATWCQPCLKELADWKQDAEKIAAAGVDVLVMNVDVEAADREHKVTAALSALALPFETASGSTRLVEQFDVLQRSLLSRQRPLPVPSSFLIDSVGRIAVVYKGPIDLDTVIADARLDDAEPRRRLAAAIPFEGRWQSPPPGSTPLHITIKFIEGGLIDEALGYIEALVQQKEKHPEYLSASLMNVYGAALLDRKQVSKAKSAFAASLELDPDNRQAHIELGTILLRLGQGKDAAKHFQVVLRFSPTETLSGGQALS